MKKFSIVAVHRDSGLVKGFTLEARSSKAALRAAKFTLRQAGETAVAYRYLVTEAQP